MLLMDVVFVITLQLYFLLSGDCISQSDSGGGHIACPHIYWEEISCEVL